MKKIILLCTLLLIVTGIPAQSEDQNYVLTRTNTDASGTAYIDNIKYYDGLGRIVETVQKNAFSNGSTSDLVSVNEYSAENRISKSWIPGSRLSGNGQYVDTRNITGSLQFPANDGTPYVEPIYENSPYNRVNRLFGAGSNWRSSGASVRTEWYTNSSANNTSLNRYRIYSDGVSLSCEGAYPYGRLYVTKTTDEDGNITMDFINGLDQNVLHRVVNNGENLDTYFVYDDWGNLRYVLPPTVVSQVGTSGTYNISSNTALQEYAYYYEYDRRNQCVLKKIPGTDPVKMFYDKAGHLVFSQNGNMRSKSNWFFYLFDELGRPTVTGICYSPDPPAAPANPVTSEYSGSSSYGGYSCSLSIQDPAFLSINYYDNYSFKELDNTESYLEYKEMPSFGAGYPNSSGMLTGQKVYKISGTSGSTVKSIYYDKKGNIIQTHSTNDAGGYDHDYFSYTFTGKQSGHRHDHSGGNRDSITELTTYTYDNMDRLLSTKYKLNDNPEVTLAGNTYNLFGLMSAQNIGGQQPVTFQYNVRNWMTEISSPLFSEDLTYESALNGVTPAKRSFNGNISAIRWKASDDNVYRGYSFRYDGAGRLTEADYGEGTGRDVNPDRYSEDFTYDKMGNITTLSRQGLQDDGKYGSIDQLTYFYEGNQVRKITDGVTGPFYSGAFHFTDHADEDAEYDYDSDGNMTKDLNKEITRIEYNCLNLPDKIEHADGTYEAYDYDASGKKTGREVLTRPAGQSQAMVSAGSNVTDAQLPPENTYYCNNIIYTPENMVMIRNDYGYAFIDKDKKATMHYYLRDHEGSVRVVFDQNARVEQVNHYYEFGGLMGSGSNGSLQPYKYNGKELDRTHELDLYDYGARNYDAIIGSWTTMDPLAERTPEVSPYVYCEDNPVNAIDPDGKNIIITGA